MSNQQETAEKSVQTHDSSVSNTNLLVNHPENTATEVANTLVSMASGGQRTITTIQDLNVMNVTHTSLSPALTSSSVEQYTITNGIPPTFTYEPQKHITIIQSNDGNEMSTDEYQSGSNQSIDNAKSKQRKRTKTQSSNKGQKQTTTEAIQYGPIIVKPRKRMAPTLASGRRSKDDPLPPEEEMKRKQRRDRNKHAAAKCRRKRNELREELEKTEKILNEQQQNLQQTVMALTEHKNQLECLLQRHICARKATLPISTNASHQITKTDLKTIPNATALLESGTNTINTKRITINFSNPQDFLALAPVTRVTTTGDISSTSLPMITIHILPEGAQTVFGSAALDRARLLELLQQTSANNTNQTSTVMMNNVPTDSIMSTNTSSNSTS